MNRAGLHVDCAVFMFNVMQSKVDEGRKPSADCGRGGGRDEEGDASSRSLPSSSCLFSQTFMPSPSVPFAWSKLKLPPLSITQDEPSHGMP
jgi:hypothetical protein